MVGVAGRCVPGYEQVEVELADQLQTLDVLGTVARFEHGSDPLAFTEVDCVARKQHPAVRTAPQETRRAVCVSRRWDHFEVVVQDVALRVGGFHSRFGGDRLTRLLVKDERADQPVGGDLSFVMVV